MSSLDTDMNSEDKDDKRTAEEEEETSPEPSDTEEIAKILQKHRQTEPPAPTKVQVVQLTQKYI